MDSINGNSAQSSLLNSWWVSARKF